MFDDQPVNQPGVVPNNLPLEEPEDVFAGVDPADTASMPSAMDAGKLQPKASEPIAANPVADIPLATPPPVQMAEVQPETPTITTMPPELQGAQQQYSNPAPEAAPLYVDDVKSPNIGRIIGIIMIVLVGAAVLGVGIWYGLTRFLASPATPTPTPAPAVFPMPETDLPETTDIPNPPREELPVSGDSTSTSTTISATDAPPNIPLPVARPTEGSQQDITENQILFGEDLDSDEDGLPDWYEIQINTDPYNWDTDGDELGDGDEVLVWGTDPLNPDTDGDGYTDGAEVNSGYDPLRGDGARLFEIGEPASEDV